MQIRACEQIPREIVTTMDLTPAKEEVSALITICRLRNSPENL